MGFPKSQRGYHLMEANHCKYFIWVSPRVGGNLKFLSSDSTFVSLERSWSSSSNLFFVANKYSTDFPEFSPTCLSTSAHVPKLLILSLFSFSAWLACPGCHTIDVSYLESDSDPIISSHSSPIALVA